MVPAPGVLVTPNAPFDQYLRGDAQAVSPEVKRGYAMFKSYGCSSCHQGVAIGGIPTPNRSASDLIDAGYAIVLSGSDVGFLRDGARAQLKALVEAFPAARRR